MSRTRLEATTNIAIIVAALALVALVIYRFLPQKAVSTVTRTPQIGESIALPPVAQSRLVAVLQTGCHFCDQSMPFYKQLVESNDPVIFVFPQKANEATLHLQNAGITTTDVVQATLESMHTSATPTLLLVDANNKILKSWVGVVSAEQQSEVKAAIGNLPPKTQATR